MKPKVKRCEVKGDKFMRGGIAGDVYSLQNPEQFKELITIYNDLSEKSDLIKGYYLDHTDNSIVFLTEPNISDLGKDEIYGYVEPLKEKGFSIIDFDKSVNYKKYRFGLDWGTEKGSMVKQDGKEGKGNPQWFKLYLKKQIKFDGGGQVMSKESYEVGDKIRFRDKYRNQEHDGIIDEINERGTYVVGYGSGLTTGIRGVEKEEVIGAYPKVEVKKKRFGLFDDGGEVGRYNQWAKNIYENQSEQQARQGLIQFAKEEGFDYNDVEKALQIYKYDTEENAWGELYYTEKAIRNMISMISNKKYAKGGGVETGYNVFNYTDNVYATDEVFKTKKSANEFIKEFRNRFSKQGYYRDNQMNKIAIEDIDLLAIPTDFSPFRKMVEGGGVGDKITIGSEIVGSKKMYFIYNSEIGKKSKYFNSKEEAEKELYDNESQKYGGGGSIAEGNYHMILSQAKEVKHHVDELQDILKKEDTIEAWVVAKMENVSSTLSDVTHYLDGKSDMPKAKRGMKVKSESLNKGMGVYADNENQLEVIQDIKPILDKKGIKLRFGSRVGKSPQTIIFDNEFQDGALRISGNGYNSEYLPTWYGDEFGSADDLEYLIDNPNDEYAKGGETPKAKRGMKVRTNELPTYTIHLNALDKDLEFDYDFATDVADYVSGLPTERQYDKFESEGYALENLFGVEMSTSGNAQIEIPRDAKIKEKVLDYINTKYKNKIKVSVKETTDMNTNSMAKDGMKFDENEGELKYYEVEVEYGEGNIDVDITTKSYDEAEKRFVEVLEEMKFNKEINVVKLNAVFKSGVVETIDSEYREDFYGDTYENEDYEEYAEGGETPMAKRGMKVDKIEYPSITLKEKDLNDDQAEIYGFIENYEPLNRQMDAIRKNLMTKIARGQFDEKKAPKIFMYLIDNGLKSYEKLHGDIELSKKEKEEIANNMVIDFMSEAELGNYENETFLPKKYLAEDGMFIMTYDVYDQDGDLVGFGLASQEVIDYANLIWYYDMMDEDGEEIDDIDVAIDFLEQSEFNIERHNPKNSSSATKKKKVRRASVK